ncbi:MAG: quinone-dependent dihydroorotate dehydrogenase [Trueperaceae bacterium]
MYELAKGALFRLDAERAHDLVLGGLAGAGRSVLARRALAGSYALHDPRLRVEAFGLSFANPLGVAAGLDKRAVAVPAFGAMGFGSVEVGSVTALAQPGNPKPRLFRLPEDEALINRMGFNNDGADVVTARLARLRGSLQGGETLPVVGVNVGKSRVVEIEQAADDYRRSLTSVWPVADYVVINVSSPNTPGLRSLQESEGLGRVLGAAAEVRAASDAPLKPLLLKLSPDMEDEQLREAVAVAEEYGASGIVATNTTLDRHGLRSQHAGEAGGLSGRPLTARALRTLELLRENTELPLVAAGGIMTGADALERMLAGADLLQVYTGFIYRGPGLVREVLGALLREVERRGLSGVAALRGA